MSDIHIFSYTGIIFINFHENYDIKYIGDIKLPKFKAKYSRLCDIEIYLTKLTKKIFIKLSKVSKTQCIFEVYNENYEYIPFLAEKIDLEIFAKNTIVSNIWDIN